MCLCPEEGGKEGDQVGLRKADLRTLGRSLMSHVRQQWAVAWKLLVSVESSKRSLLLNLELRKVGKGKFPGAWAMGSEDPTDTAFSPQSSCCRQAAQLIFLFSELC